MRRILSIVKSLTEYFGLPFISNVEAPKQQTVVTQGSPLNIRARPSTDAQVVGQSPKGATVTVPVSYTHLDVYKRQAGGDSERTLRLCADGESRPGKAAPKAGNKTDGRTRLPYRREEMCIRDRCDPMEQEDLK